MGRWYRTDLHVHTCLSPCADLTMSPKRVIEQAKKMNLDIIAICDHNSAENVTAAQRLGDKHQLTVLAGMEVTSREEVHFLALFDHARSALDLQDIVYDRLIQDGDTSPVGEDQIVANEHDEVERFCPHFLFSATTLTTTEVVELIHNLKGLAIAAHIDREHYSLIGQLGFIPPDLQLDAIELSGHQEVAQAFEKFPEIKNYPVLSASDAHYLKEIGRSTTSFHMDQPDTAEIRRALGEEGRRRLGA